MYQAIFIDIDGTLRNSEHEITQRTIKAIKNVVKEGILVVICSGRPRTYTENISRQCGASHYIITSNGGNIYDYEKQEILYTDTMNKKACLELYKIAEKANARFIMNVGANRVVTKLKHFDGSEEELKGDIETFLKENNVIQCVIADTNFDKIKNLKKEIEKIKGVEIKNQHKSLLDSNAPKTGSFYYDIANLDSCKGNAIQKFCELKQINTKDVIAIGDDVNDISMFKIVGYSVVMENAIKEVKKYADEITTSNDEEGVAYFLEKLLDKREIKC